MLQKIQKKFACNSGKCINFASFLKLKNCFIINYKTK